MSGGAQQGGRQRASNRDVMVLQPYRLRWKKIWKMKHKHVAVEWEVDVEVEIDIEVVGVVELGLARTDNLPLI